MAQNHFNIKRFFNAFKYYSILNIKSYLSFIIGLIIGLIFIDIFFIFTFGRKVDHNDYAIIFYFTSIICTVLVVGTSFPLLRNKKSVINYLMLPASLFEKFLIQFISRIVLFIPFFLLLFWLDFKIATAIYNLVAWRNKIQIGSFGMLDPLMDIKLINTLDIVAVICWGFTLITFLFAGASYFKKYALFKTILSFTILLAVVFMICSLFTLFFFPEKFNLSRNPVYISDYRLSKTLWNIQLWVYVIGVLSSLFLLPLAYFKLKEKEI